MRVKQKFYWPGHYNDVCNWCRTCGSCAASKTPTTRNRARLKPIVVGYSLQIVATDIVGPLPESDVGNKYILVVGDYFTHCLSNAQPRSYNSSPDRYLCRFGIPKQLHSDQGKQFESDLLKEVCRIFRTDKSRTTPQSDGLIERYNRTPVDNCG